MLMEPTNHVPGTGPDRQGEGADRAARARLGNGECFIQRDAGRSERSELYMTLEAPNHATVSVTVPAETDEKG